MFESKIDRESFDIAVASKEEVIACLEARVASLEAEVERQRQRADMAVDRLLAKYQCPTVMPENIVWPKSQPEHVSEQVKVMEALKSEIESIGDISGEDPDPTTRVEAA